MSGSQHNSGLAILYCSGNSWLHKLHPFNKLVYVLLIGVVVYCLPRAIVTSVAVVVFNLVLAFSAKVLGRSWQLIWRIILPLATFMLPIHGMLFPGNRQIIYDFWWIQIYQEGLLFSFTILLQLTALLTASLLFVLTTHPVDLTAAIQQAGLPQWLAYLIGSPLLMLPVMRERIATIQDAQRSRGLESEGNVIKRFFCLFPLVAPFVLSSLVQVEQRAIALELRGFNGPGAKTSLRVVHDDPWQRGMRWLMFFTALVVLVFTLISSL